MGWGGDGIRDMVMGEAGPPFRVMRALAREPLPIDWQASLKGGRKGTD